MDLMSKKKYFFILSVVLIGIGLIGLIVNGLILDVQFKGGTRIVTEMEDNEFDTNEAEGLLKEALGKQVTVQKLEPYDAENKAGNIYMMRIDIAGGEALSSEERDVVRNIVSTNYNVKENAEEEVLSVEPMIGRELLSKGIQAAIISIILIVLYVAWRFSVMSGFSAALMALVALAHDAAIMFSVYTLFKIPLNEVFIAALLTILGYSLNDTIVIYDRIRENTKKLRKLELSEIVNTSLLQTMTRSINTTFTTVLCVLTIYIFASINDISSLKEFSLPLIVGMISGAYSSIFIASPLWMLWRQSSLRKKVKRA